MRRTQLLAFLALPLLIAAGGVAGCVVNIDDDNTPIRNPPTTEDVKLEGLDGKVDVVVDDRGMPHIYATTVHDAVMVQGYLMAKDRYPQMEIVRRNVTGELAAFIGGAVPGIVEGDVAARVIGFKRIANRIYDSLPANDPTKAAVEAFAQGVNIYVKGLRDRTEKLPDGADLVQILIDQPDAFVDWTPQDSLAIGRYLSHALSYGASDEVGLTEAMAAVADKFPAGDPREGLFRDFWSFAPARDVFTRDGFPNVGMDSGSTAILPQPLRGKAAPHIKPAPPLKADLAALKSARPFLASVDRLSAMLGDESRGSNDWVVSGSKTASGAPLLANDPHLSLPSPPLFWYSHLNTKRAGGDLDVAGISLIGAPGVILGFNENIAWGATTAGHDVTDVYQETITEGQNGAPPTVLWNKNQVPIEKVTETIKVSGANDIVFDLERVPHHGIIIPKIKNGLVVPRTEPTALSVRWTGDDVSYEMAAFFGLSHAKNLDEARAALDKFEVGAQSFVVVTIEGDIFWSTQSKMPVHDPQCMTYDPATQKGIAPAFVMPGDGSCEWKGFLEDKYIPHDQNPARGFIATANNDLVGVTADGNPFNDPHYTTWDSDIGHRVARITERLTELTQQGGVKPEDMMSIQGDHKSPLGALLASSFVKAAKRAAEERATPGTHADLSDLVKNADAGALDRLAEAVTRLEAWTSFETPPGVDIGDGEPMPAEVEDSIATSIFNASMLEVVKLSFGDERTAIGRGPSSGNIAKVLQWAILEPQKLATYDAQLGDTVLWDDLTTPAVKETRDERIVRGMLGALAFLKGELGDDVKQWRWGRIHKLTFEAIVPSLTGESAATIPRPGDTTFPDGFPRPGDNFGVDASNFGMWNPASFTYDSGPVQRLVVEMTPDGPRAWNALPGGQHYDPDSKHHADEAELWRRNKATPLYFTDADVNAHVELKLSFTHP